MSDKSSISNVMAVERRRHWRGRRAGNDRRNPARLSLTSGDCRSVVPRRIADLSGALSDGEIWWNQSAT